MAMFSNHSDGYDVHGELASLRKEVASLSRALSKQGRSAYRSAADEAGDLYSDIADRFMSALPVIKRRTHDLERTIADNPTRTVAVVGLAALAVAAAVMLSGSRR